MREAETAADQAAVAEDLPDLIGVCGGADVEVFGFFPQQEVPDSPADKVGYMAVAMEAVKDLQGVRVDTGTGDRMLRAGNDRRFWMDGRILGSAVHCSFNYAYMSILSSSGPF